MVYIKRVSIQGFKSFGSRRVVIKPERGFVVITGPNGGGKSNVLDAIKFSLGELSVNALRVGKLSDLIHENNGKRLGQATVTLALDNSDKSLPLDTDEVMVSRTIYSNGESTYRVNGKTVSRNELLSILASANIRPSGFNIITQGAVLSIAEKSPEELRRIIDEVAGVSEFDRRRAEALKELEVAEKNVAIARAGLEELKSRVKQLELERSRLTRNQLISRYLSQLRRRKLLEQLNELDEKLLSLGNEERLLEGRRAEASKNLEDLLRERQEKLSKLKGIEEEISEIQRRMSVLRSGGRGGGASLESLKSSIRGEGKRYSKTKQEIRELWRRLEINRAEVSALEVEYGEAEKKRRQQTAELDEMEHRLANLKERRSILLASLARWREALADAESKRASLTRELSQIEARITLTEQRISEVSQKIAEDKEALERIKVEKGLIEAELDRAQVSLADYDKQLSDLREESRRLRFRISHYEGVREEARVKSGELFRLKAEVEGALNLLGEVRGTVSGNNQTPAQPEITKLRDLLHSLGPKGEEISPLLLDYLEALVVGKDSLALALALAAAERGIRLSVISLEEDHGQDCRANDCLACTLAGGNKELRKLLHTIYPNHSFSGDGWFERGRPAINQTGINYNGHGVFHVLAEVGLKKRLEKLLSEVEKAVKSLGEVGGRCEAILRGLHGELSRVEERIAGVSIERQESIARIARLIERREELEAEEKKISERRERLRDEHNNLQMSIALLQEELEHVRRKVEEVAEPQTTEAEELQSQLEDINSEINAIERRVGEVNAVVRSIRQQLERIKSRRDELFKTIEEIEGEVERLVRDADISKKRLKELSQLYLEAWRSANERMGELEALSNKMSEALKDRGVLSEELSLLENRVEEERAKLLSLETQARSLAVARVELSMSRNSILERLSSMIEAPIDDLSHLPDEFLDDVGKELEAELGEVVMVNQLAGLQYSELIVEYKGRSGNIAILEEERRRILEILEMLDAKKLEAFMRTFSKVSEMFGKYFTALTGGSAWLEFSEPEKPLESGVEMYVTFPGKSPKPSRSISGGEKSVAAVALLMAFQGLTPVDFLIMDEVDAHMDANYSKNLASLLREFSKRTQVIAVSLKDVIAEKADQLIGVYNQDGESRVVVTRLEENQS
ncbi:MAG: chromosome segregation SMC family protein [Nitrososphaerota archaeon]